MGTDKRARQKAGRQARLEALQAQQQQAKRKRSAIWIVGVVALFLVVGLAISLLFGGGDDSGDDVAATVPTSTSTGQPVAFTYGTGECAPEGGSTDAKKSFDAAPKLCIDPTKSYLATFTTSEGVVKVALDTQRTPGTVNNFINLARWKYYDGTVIFRTDPSIDIIQGGGMSNTDDPGYTIPDEGLPFTYQPGDLTMANTGQPNSGGGQWFFGVGPKVANLDGQGSYVTFGHVTEGLDVLESILALNVDNGGGLGGAPSKTVTLQKVEISEV